MPLFWLGVVTALSLVLHVARAGLYALVERAVAAGRTPRLPPGFAGVSFGWILEIALVVSVIACSIAFVVWVHDASVKAHAFAPNMKHSPWSGVGWLVFPLINFFMSLSVVYDLWAASGGDRSKGRMVLVWYGAYAVSAIPCWMWASGVLPNLLGQIIVAFSSLASLALARRIARMQVIAATAAEFGPADEAEAVVHSEFPLPDRETFEPAPRTVRLVEPRKDAGPCVIYAPRARS
jgi:hypothetical protein